MGMYATIKHTEVKYSGLLAEAGSEIKRVEDGAITFSRAEVLGLAVKLASKISAEYVMASAPYTVVALRMACDKLLLILDWIELREKELTFC